MNDNRPIIHVHYVTNTAQPDASIWFMFSRIFGLIILLGVLALFVRCCG